MKQKYTIKFMEIKRSGEVAFVKEFVTPEVSVTEAGSLFVGYRNQVARLSFVGLSFLIESAEGKIVSLKELGVSEVTLLAGFSTYVSGL